MPILTAPFRAYNSHTLTLASISREQLSRTTIIRRPPNHNSSTTALITRRQVHPPSCSPYRHARHIARNWQKRKYILSPPAAYTPQPPLTVPLQVIGRTRRKNRYGYYVYGHRVRADVDGVLMYKDYEPRRPDYEQRTPDSPLRKAAQRKAPKYERGHERVCA